MARIEVRLNDEEKKVWEAFCQKQGVTGAAMLRRMIQHVTQGRRFASALQQKRYTVD